MKNKRTVCNEKKSINTFIPLSDALPGHFYAVQRVSLPEQTEKRLKELGLIKNRVLYVTMKTPSFIILKFFGFYLPLRNFEADSITVKTIVSHSIS